VRVAVILAAITVVATPAHASSSCMSKTEAHRHFGSAHIYRHGSHHCWNATHRHVVVARVDRSNPQPDRQSEPEQRASRSEISPDNRPGSSVPVRIEHVHVQSEPGKDPAADAANSDRQVDRQVDREADRQVDSIAAIPMIKAESDSEIVAATPLTGAEGPSTTTVLGVALLLFGTTLAGVGVLFALAAARGNRRRATIRSR